ncbi:hypothetical protein LJ656_08990 [Paraburkholderia sp. MMS20-SJTR3]|uniref:Uncharacterized protein n=1 Tax=Paraburkholderia sejongensis TaxID=2886946 RepID=A0ABS8JS75_9BURK|nr:hypothetical protein [Paraburkholderia sp. MMS20-SJTR3]MCC8392722.1 hypothetical protein [Paraburkholderia sp. MMS20-SJTR3]
MKTLMIKDLSVTEQLDSKAMRTVRGGFGPSLYYNFSPFSAPNNSKTLTATQVINNELNFQNANGNNVALAGGAITNMSPYLVSSNSANQ